jgi:hypothetical protein
MGVDHCGGDIGMAEEFLHGANVVAAFEQVGGEGVVGGMTGGVFSNADFGNGIGDGASSGGIFR